MRWTWVKIAPGMSKNWRISHQNSLWLEAKWQKVFAFWELKRIAHIGISKVVQTEFELKSTVKTNHSSISCQKCCKVSIRPSKSYQEWIKNGIKSTRQCKKKPIFASIRNICQFYLALVSLGYCCKQYNQRSKWSRAEISIFRVKFSA